MFAESIPKRQRGIEIFPLLAPNLDLDGYRAKAVVIRLKLTDKLSNLLAKPINVRLRASG